MTTSDSLYQLVDKFAREPGRYAQPEYNEAQLREEFVNPFFRALGWDLGEQVLHEAGLRSGGTIKHPDYTFLAGNRRAFYVETKKPAIDIGSAIEPAEQLRAYGWSGDTALGILTNFAEFAVYDCRIEPKQGDSAEEARVLYLTHSQYLDHWERLRATLSPEAVRQGAHRDLLEATAKGVLRVDEAFLRDMESWRADLAEHLHKQARFIDRRLSQRELNHLVQRTIDRIVFLRIAEDRKLEEYGRLERAASVRRGVYNAIKTLYLAAGKRYNSGLFHFDPTDKSRPDADTLSLEIYIVDNVLRRIIGDLYPPKSRYQFSVISADILGQVYERFLGKVIEVRSDDVETRVTVEEKPEARKAGGVYYTPGYIVDYIVENTVGALLQGKTPAEAAQLRMLDPACGSGSFLTGAYQYLLDWHLKQYSEAPARYQNRIRHTSEGLILRIEEKRRILLNNIYGVDLDQNAVEVSKLALLLKMLENEGDGADLHELAEPLLPDLRGNIKWGNSLIGSDFFSGTELAALDDEELLRVKPFDWAGGSGFGAIMARGGFDAVIGNPPYGAEIPSEQVTYLSTKHGAGAKFPDSYIFFIIKALQLLMRSERMSFIVPNTFCDLESLDEFRKWILTENSILKIWQSGWAFKDAVVDTLVFVAQKDKPTTDSSVLIEINEKTYERKISSFVANELRKIDYRNSEDDKQILRKVVGNTIPLSEIATVRAGVKMYERGKGTPPQTRELIKERPYSTKEEKRVGWKTLYRGKHISRYAFASPDEYVNYGEWLAAPRKPELFASPKILMRRTDDRLLASLDDENAICVNSCHVIKFKKASPALSYSYILGLLNSRLMQRIYELQNPQMVDKVFAEVKVIYVLRLPIRTIDFEDSADKIMHDTMVELVDTMLDLHRQLPGLTAVQRGVVEQRIEAVDREIDGLVYRLYGLSVDEVGIVEGGER
ncbi:MAG: N-6 DNA methylase [Chloroflexi bacterium]|nr:N-6 DNA methylase [Chloroflexota bacterium]